MQKQEIKESIELPLSHPDLYYKLGIDPPSGKIYFDYIYSDLKGFYCMVHQVQEKQ